MSDISELPAVSIKPQSETIRQKTKHWARIAFHSLKNGQLHTPCLVSYLPLTEIPAIAHAIEPEVHFLNCWT
ncbi:MAG: hypothetical protein ACJAR9_000669 [Celeribacter sp.]|jgi:hypothetical protein